MLTRTLWPALGLLAVAAAATPARALQAQITVGPAVHISAAHPTDPFGEPFLAINPRDTRNLVAIVNVFRGPRDWSDVYASLDGGRTWVQGRGPVSDSIMFVGGDPVVFFDASGTAYMARYGGGKPENSILSVSTDGGRTWARRGLTPHADRPFLAADQTGGRYRGRVYEVTNFGPEEGRYRLDGTSFEAAVSLYVSTDSGRTFANTAGIFPDKDGERARSGDILVLPDGTVVLVFGTAAGEHAKGTPGVAHIVTAVSRDGGQTFAAIRRGPAIQYWHPILRSTADLSTGLSRGRLYATYVERDLDDFYRPVLHRSLVQVATSADTGKTWDVTRVSDNATGWITNPAIAVNKDGVVGVIWNDFRDDPTHRCYHLYFSASTDGGITFLPNVRASDRPTCPTAVSNWAPSVQYYWGGEDDPARDSDGVWRNSQARLPHRRDVRFMAQYGSVFANGGETQGLVADSGGVFHAAWINGASGVAQLYAQRFAVTEPPLVIDSSRVELTPQLQLVMSPPVRDMATGTVSTTVQLKNISTAPIGGPVTIVLDRMQSVLSNFRVRNADNKLPGRGAAWEILSPKAAPLSPGATSVGRVVTWSFAAEPPPGYQSQFQMLRASFLILGPTK